MSNLINILGRLRNHTFTALLVGNVTLGALNVGALSVDKDLEALGYAPEAGPVAAQAAAPTAPIAVPVKVPVKNPTPATLFVSRDVEALGLEATEVPAPQLSAQFSAPKLSAALTNPLPVKAAVVSSNNLASVKAPKAFVSNNSTKKPGFFNRISTASTPESFKLPVLSPAQGTNIATATLNFLKRYDYYRCNCTTNPLGDEALITRFMDTTEQIFAAKDKKFAKRLQATRNAMGPEAVYSYAACYTLLPDTKNTAESNGAKRSDERAFKDYLLRFCDCNGQKVDSNLYSQASRDNLSLIDLRKERQSAQQEGFQFNIIEGALCIVLDLTLGH